MKIEQSETVSLQWNWKLAGSKLTHDIQVYVVKGDKKRTASIRLLLKRFKAMSMELNIAQCCCCCCFFFFFNLIVYQN